MVPVGVVLVVDGCVVVAVEVVVVGVVCVVVVVVEVPGEGGEDEEPDPPDAEPPVDVPEGAAFPLWPVEPVADEEPADDGLLVALLDFGEFATSPLAFSSVSIVCWTAATSEATAAGVPPAPRAGSAFSFFSACSSCDSRAFEG